MDIVARVSPKFMGTKLLSGTIDDQLDVYEDRLLGWFLNPARTLASTDDGKFAALTLILTYFEPHWIYRTGIDSRNQEGRYFKQAFLEVFPPKYTGRDGSPGSVSVKGEDVASLFYTDGRCGLYHAGMPRFSIALGGTAPFTLTVDQQGAIGSVFINVPRFVERVHAHFRSYVAQLRDPANIALRDPFMRAWAIYNPREPMSLPEGGLP